MTGLLGRLVARAAGPPPRFRAESFGGLVAAERPAALLYVDRDRARAMGHDGGALWRGPAPDDPVGARLRAPVEVHLALTSRCPVGCAGCYVGATPAGRGDDLDTAGWKAALDELAAAGVFHVALGGGESALRDDLFELARHARARGLTPNLTTSGLGVTEAWAAEAMALFGRINVSVDGPPEVHEQSRGVDGFAVAAGAVRRLRRHGRRVGLNTVVSRATFPHLDRLGAVARSLGVDEVELLRFKPAGRGKAVWRAMDLTPAQADAFLDAAVALGRRRRLRVRMDCSFLPMLAARALDPAALRRFGVLGCEGGNHLAAVRPDGRLTACSFWEHPEPAGPDGTDGDVRSLRSAWRREGAFEPFRGYVVAAREPCRSCDTLAICRGGCRAVALHVTGDPMAPDPGCPRVRAWEAARVGEGYSSQIP